MEAPTTLGWGFFSSDRASGCVLWRVHVETCGLCQLAIWSVLGHRSLSSGRSSLRPHSPPRAGSPQGVSFRGITINNLRPDESSGCFFVITRGREPPRDQRVESAGTADQGTDSSRPSAELGIATRYLAFNPRSRTTGAPREAA